MKMWKLEYFLDRKSRLIGRFVSHRPRGPLLTIFPRGPDHVSDLEALIGRLGFHVTMIDRPFKKTFAFVIKRALGHCKQSTPVIQAKNE